MYFHRLGQHNSRCGCLLELYWPPCSGPIVQTAQYYYFLFDAVFGCCQFLIAIRRHNYSFHFAQCKVRHLCSIVDESSRSCHHLVAVHKFYYWWCRRWGFLYGYHCLVDQLKEKSEVSVVIFLTDQTSIITTRIAMIIKPNATNRVLDILCINLLKAPWFSQG
jgi:hypothetical protein